MLQVLAKWRPYLWRWAVVVCIVVGGVYVIQRVVIGRYLAELDQLFSEQPQQSQQVAIPRSKLTVEGACPWLGQLEINWPAVTTMRETSEKQPVNKAPEVKRDPFDPWAIALPVTGQLMAGFGWQRHPEYGDWRYFDGVVLSAHQELIAASGSGMVHVLEGTKIKIDHGDGWETIYEDLDAVLVSDGQVVVQGETIGRKTGAGSGLLTWKVFYRGQAQDPTKYVRFDGAAVVSSSH